VPALPSAAAFGHDALDLVPPFEESLLDPLHEHAEVGVLGTGIHL
jgi:hypothetical protein